jgi:IS30 family transposase
MARPGPPPKIAAELRDDVCCLVLAGVPPQLVAAELGVCANTVSNLVRARFPGRRKRGRPRCYVDVVDLRRRVLAGETAREIAKALGVSEPVVLDRAGSLRRMRIQREAQPRSELRLSFEEREEISRGILAGRSASSIARSLGRAPSTITREIRRCGGRSWYRAWKAEERFFREARRPKRAKLASNEALRARVEEGLANFWSPEQISGHLRREFPDDPSMRVSHETIYQSLYVQSRGALRAELKRYLRWKRMARRTRGVPGDCGRGKIRDMVMISARPPEAADRAVPGHWEGDLLIGRGGKSAIATLVERRSRFVMLAALPDGRSAENVNQAVGQRVKTLPEELRRTLTWDQGKEMAQHASFTIDCGVQVYFCDPHSPWQRGSNENTNGLLRQFLPRTADLSRKTQDELDYIAMLLNNRPRQTLNWERPSEVFNRAVASTG